MNPADMAKLNMKEGYMFVQSQSLWKPFSLKAKYFILTNECLYCFKRRGDLTSIPYDVIYLDDVGLSVNEERRGIRRRYCIKITSKDTKKTQNLFCFALEERDAWFTSIMKVLASRYTNDLEEKRSTTLKHLSRQSKLLLQQRSKSISCMELTGLEVVSEDQITPIQELLDLPITPLKSRRKKYSSSSLDISICHSTLPNKNKKSSTLVIPFISEKRKSKIRTNSISASSDDSSDELPNHDAKRKLKRMKVSLGIH